MFHNIFFKDDGIEKYCDQTFSTVRPVELNIESPSPVATHTALTILRY